MLPGNKLLNINLDVTALNTADINKNWKKKAQIRNMDMVSRILQELVKWLRLERTAGLL